MFERVAQKAAWRWPPPASTVRTEGEIGASGEGVPKVPSPDHGKSVTACIVASNCGPTFRRLEQARIPRPRIWHVLIGTMQQHIKGILNHRAVMFPFLFQLGRCNLAVTWLELMSILPAYRRHDEAPRWQLGIHSKVTSTSVSSSRDRVDGKRTAEDVSYPKLGTLWAAPCLPC